MTSSVISKFYGNRRHWPMAVLLVCCVAYGFLGLTGLLPIAILTVSIMVSRLWSQRASRGKDQVTGLQNRSTLLPHVATQLLNCTPESQTDLIFILLSIDAFDALEERRTQTEIDAILLAAASGMRAQCKSADCSFVLDRGQFAIVTEGRNGADVTGLLTLTIRLQHDICERIHKAGGPARQDLSIGFARASQLSDPSEADLLQAAKMALAEARRHGPGAVRSFSKTLSRRRAEQDEIGKAAVEALENEEFVAFFQPQIDLRDGSISGFEALARWKHPKVGMISPADFLPVLEQQGLMGRLGEVMVKQALSAMKVWDDNGLEVPRVGVNFSSYELRNSHLVENVALHLDAMNLSPDRLTIEVLETVVAKDTDDMVVRNLSDFADLGCGIDLDDFGTGYASITNIRRFCVGRIKIDRSFITGLDRDPEQRNMVGAILTMAEKLGVSTLAEGVETRGECAALVDLGCRHAQGFQIARPMPLCETLKWIDTSYALPSAPSAAAKRAV